MIKRKRNANKLRCKLTKQINTKEREGERDKEREREREKETISKKTEKGDKLRDRNQRETGRDNRNKRQR